MKNKLLIAFGTRPEYIKLKPLMDSLSCDDYLTVFTGQHTTLMPDIDFDFRLTVNDGDNRLDSIIQSCLNQDHIFKNVSAVMVQGDTSSALGMAISAFHRKIKVIHLEAGLRSFDMENPFPEEMNRCLISKLSSIQLCPTENNKKNLLDEKIDGGNIHVVGNTVLDNLIDKKLQSSFSKTVLITLHRRENHQIIKEWFEEINQLSKRFSDYKFIFPMHPNPNIQQYKEILSNVTVIPPIDYDQMILHLMYCSLIISDSGGIQEESSFLNKKVLVCRKFTERQESVGVTSFLVTPSTLSGEFEKHIVDPVPETHDCPYGDGKSSEKIIKILRHEKII